MKRTLFLSVLVAGVALALAAGSYSVLAGTDPITEVAGVVTGAEDPDDDDDIDDADDDDDDDDEVSVQTGVDGNDAEGAGHVAEVIATTFDADQEDVLALHEEGIGFGAIFKLYLLAAAADTSVEELLATIEANGDGGFAFGKLFKELTDEVSVLTDGEEGMPNNLGKAVSNSKKDDEVVVSVDGDEDDGQGPPEHAPAHGRNRD